MQSLRTLLVPVCLSLLAFGANAARGQIITSDLSFVGEYVFDDDRQDSWTSSRARQSGTLYAREGGIVTAVEYQGGRVSSGTNPLVATFSHIGDGFGGTGTAMATGGGTFRADTDQYNPLTVSNLSSTITYRILMELFVDHDVATVAGTESRVRSDLELDLNGVDFVDAEIISRNRRFGNEVNGVLQGTRGGLVADQRTIPISFLLSPGGIADLELDYTLENSVGDSTPNRNVVSTGNVDYSLTIVGVQAIPEPSSAILLAVIGCSCVVWRSKTALASLWRRMRSNGQ